MKQWYLGVDVGGTFTDFALFSEGGDFHCIKVPSTPQRPSEATLTGIDEAIAALDMSAEELASLKHTHGNTIAVNTLIERRGATLGVIVNRGFRDIFELARLGSPNPMRYDARRPAPLVPRERVREIGARIDARGNESEAVQESEVVAAVTDLVARGATGIVVCLLHSYRSPGQEQAVARIIAAHWPALRVELSSAVWPQAREYERAVLATINAYVRPAQERYIDDLVAGTRARGIADEPRITRSNGGSQGASTIRSSPITAFLSGPAAGVTAAAHIAAEAGLGGMNLVTVDVGGTSADVGIVQGGKAVLSSEEHVANFPLLVPTIAVSSVGAGGGSELWVDEAGSLKVGPRSVGSNPGPACYGRGGTTAALSDAMLVAGLLSPTQLLGGRVALDLGAARRAIAPLASRLDRSIEETADGAIAIAVAIMSAETSAVLARRGVDARESVLVPFGGAGPLTGALLAEDVYIDRVLVSPTPGALSAIGAVFCDIQGDFVEPVYCGIEEFSPPACKRALDAITAKATEWMAREESLFQVASKTIHYAAEMRYHGQGFDVTVPLERNWLERGDAARVAAAFHEAHQSAYGHHDLHGEVFISELRAQIVGQTRKPPPRIPAPAHGEGGSGSRRVTLFGKTFEAKVRQRAQLAQDEVLEGPAILEQLDTTVFVPAGWSASVRASGALLLTRGDSTDV